MSTICIPKGTTISSAQPVMHCGFTPDQFPYSNCMVIILCVVFYLWRRTFCVNVQNRKKNIRKCSHIDGYINFARERFDLHKLVNYAYNRLYSYTHSLN